MTDVQLGQGSAPVRTHTVTRVLHHVQACRLRAQVKRVSPRRAARSTAAVVQSQAAGGVPRSQLSIPHAGAAATPPSAHGCARCSTLVPSSSPVSSPATHSTGLASSLLSGPDTAQWLMDRQVPGPAGHSKALVEWSSSLESGRSQDPGYGGGWICWRSSSRIRETIAMSDADA